MKTSDLSDYTGELRARTDVRLTDRDAGVASTASDFPLSWTVPCTATADTTLGATCSSATTLDALIPGSTAEGTRAIWALGSWQVYEGGPDGDVDTEGDNSLFVKQGLFVP